MSSTTHLIRAVFPRPIITTATLLLSLHSLGSITSLIAAESKHKSEAKLPTDASLTIRADQPGARISPTLYGIFFEDINRAADGGINSELLRNPTFEEGRDLEYGRTHGAGNLGKLTELYFSQEGVLHKVDANVPHPWRLELAGNAQATMDLDLAKPLSLKNPTSLRVTVTKPGAVSLINEGFGIPLPDRLQDTPSWANTAWPKDQTWGFPVQANADYTFSLHARANAGFNGTATVRLVGSDGAILASAPVSGNGVNGRIGEEWKSFSGSLRPKSDHRTARFGIVLDGTGTVWFDCVSLKPAKTWKGHGLRPDLMEMIAAMKPGFVRFPGGCFVEGKSLSSRFDWKATLGPLQERPGHMNLWGYWTTDEVGYHEYLQMCEDLGAEPMYVANCGISHYDATPAAQVYPLIQEALDAIEYANGPVTSPWGAKRAQAGHPAPFNLKYLEIGNENGGVLYDAAYALFVDVLRQKHPELHLIACNWHSKEGIRPPTSRPVEILDEHYYESPTFFLANANRYDSYDRKGPKIYIGEFAVTSQNGAGNLMAALAESAFMTGMERNGDLVMMGSYAPLLAHPGWVTWKTDAIYFDAARAYGTPSYWAQVLFAQNRPDINLGVEVKTPEAYLGGSGCAGLAATCKAEFKDFTVTLPDGQVAYRSNFSKGMGGWQSFGKWETRDGLLLQTGKESNRAVVGDRKWTDYTVTVQAKRTEGDGGFGIQFQMPGLHFGSSWNVGGRDALFRVEDFASVPVPVTIETGRWHELKLEISGPVVRGYLDGKLIQEVQPRPTRALHAVAGRVEKNGEIVVKVVNLSDKEIKTAVALHGIRSLESNGTAIVLSGSNGKLTENCFAEPIAAGLQTKAIHGIGTEFTQSFPPNSATVLRLKKKE